ncbi:hypothetical protein [Oceanobacillus timonensis]|uniref:hypothetical protein n=1 Tax=Oceanobacillus timonensis TaxID=1926285 RepID=UPI0015C4378B|nr:hypothetical protein [Oceanobacillus timonensis]
MKDTVKIGDCHSDTAQENGNQSGVGKEIENCGVNREGLFNTTQLAAEMKS